MAATSTKTFQNDSGEIQLSLTISENMLPKFFNLLQSGFAVKAQTGVSVKAFLCDQIGLPEAYVDERIQTLFLDSKPVDDATVVRIHDGSRLALSAAMPGVAGALFRKGGRYGAMRDSISLKSPSDGSAEVSGRVMVKLFNLVLRELGPVFLAKGVWLDGMAVQDFFSHLPESWSANILKVDLNGEEIKAGELLNQAWSEKHIFTKVTSA